MIAMPHDADIDVAQLRQAEQLALGLFIYGIAFSAAALVMG